MCINCQKVIYFLYFCALNRTTKHLGMKQVKLADRVFELSIPSGVIEKAVWRMAEQMDKDLAEKDPLMLCILNGSFMFAADLMKKLDTPCQVSFVKMASYQGDSSTGKIKELIGLNEDIEGRTVVLLEDIVDTGVTIAKLIEQVTAMKPKELKVATLLFKPEACKTPVKLDYVGLEIPNDFIVGYGLDYNGYGRNLRDIYTVIP
jgi:hypoxanthine phosphoribosyltransferase